MTIFKDDNTAGHCRTQTTRASCITLSFLGWLIHFWWFNSHINFPIRFSWVEVQAIFFRNETSEVWYLKQPDLRKGSKTLSDL